MEYDPRANDRREIQRRRRYGATPSCVVCGETDPVCFHHPAGRANDPELEGPVCANCHLRLHEGMRIAGLDLRRTPRTVIEKIHALLLGLAVLFEQLAERFGHWAQHLGEFIRALDRELPNWRNVAEAWD